MIGLPELLANLNRIAAQIAGPAQEAGLHAAAEEIKTEWVANIESEGLVLTGNYRDSIRSEVDGHIARIVSDVPYAPILEFGDSRQVGHHVAERAFDEHHEDALHAVAEHIEVVTR